mmetsp:Transcript_1988/g.2105  ORF Transcript_1988/g.2105 Transcript_1988/m.2105 type:complete len:295 (-) Transcript_1988:26-910(-)|eukprot:CAMPEP_0119041870 /NCGR_PEP_ID=MMETSP1177-20130426/14074_1 /TAXON_ID=2985 /ORGANISM="Ochromonas sp, Strain CCMP1899" /LENGTH=294 /DNA_ID=CAMNT_0007008259 /DNA_START=121 /DNA_END=1005 /DNA_ORIENTATION=-
MISISRKTTILTQTSSHFRCLHSSASRFFSSVNVNTVSDDSSTINPAKEERNIRHTEREKSKVQLTELNVHLAIVKLREQAWAKFDETVEIAVNLGVDPRKPNQSVKGVARLPHGTGKIIRVCVFANGQDVADALNAGADVVGAEDLVARIQKGDMPFDTVIATPEMMALVGRIGRILGPRGMMPTPKMGSVTRDVAKAVKLAKAGAVQFRVEKAGIIQAGIGKLSFSNEQLLNNIRAFMVAVSDAKPEGMKGKYIQMVHISSTMGPGVAIDRGNVDPSNAKFMLDPSKIGNLK